MWWHLGRYYIEEDEPGPAKIDVVRFGDADEACQVKAAHTTLPATSLIGTHLAPMASCWARHKTIACTAKAGKQCK